MASVNRGKRLRLLDINTYRDRLQSQILRFTHPVIKGCWIWNGALQKNGYGQTRMLGKPTPAHRASYFAFVGEIPVGMEISHSCDVRNCVNPEHLMPATHAENMRDMSIRGRGLSGIEAGNYIPIRDMMGRFIKGNGANNAK